MNALSDELTATLPSLKQKFIVDLVNGIDVSNDRIKVQNIRGGFFNRLWDSITGSSHRRQVQINQQLVNGLDNCFEWLAELTEELTFTNTALIQVSDGLANVKSDLTSVAHFSANTRERLLQLERSVDSRIADLERQIQAVDMRQRAYQQMDSLFISWQAGNYSQLSAAQRCLLVLYELGWGVFSDYGRIASQADREELLFTLKNRLTIQLESESICGGKKRLAAVTWLLPSSPVKNEENELLEGLNYLTNGLNREKYSFNSYVMNPVGEHPSRVPYLMDADRLVKGMTQELIRDGQLYVS